MMMMQHQSNIEQREREYQLRWEEMAIAHDEARDQRQMMNLLFMQMLNRNGGGGDSNQPPVPASRTLRIYIDNCFLIYCWQYITLEYDLMITK
jgi:hypothetical protein